MTIIVKNGEGAVVKLRPQIQTVNVAEQGLPGSSGITGFGVPAGGQTGQVLGKKSPLDYDVTWLTVSGGGGTPPPVEPKDLLGICGGHAGPVESNLHYQGELLSTLSAGDALSPALPYLNGGEATVVLDVGEFSLPSSGGEDPGGVIGEAHLKDYMNPHRVTKEQIGLGAVDNLSSEHLLNRANHSGVQPPTSIGTDVSHQWMTLAEKNKLSTIQDRANHTGVQPASSIQTDSLRQWITSEEKEKLATVERNANRYVHPAKHSADEINETLNRKFVTADEKALLSSVSGSSHGHLNKDILDAMSAAFTEADKQKLDSIAYGLQPYVHPGTHPSTMIDEVGGKFFVSPEEKVLWTSHAENQENPHGVDKADVGLPHVDDVSAADLRDRATHTGVQPASSVEQDEDHQFITQAFRGLLDNSIAISHHHSNSPILNDITAAYTTEEKAKLAGIEAEANKYVHPATHSLSEITETDALKVMTSAERTKLSGIAAGANAYTHPASHPATIITEDASRRFVSDAEKAKWNTEATTAAKGVVQLATTAEAQAGTDATRAVTPAGALAAMQKYGVGAVNTPYTTIQDYNLLNVSGVYVIAGQAANVLNAPTGGGAFVEVMVYSPAYISQTATPFTGDFYRKYHRICVNGVWGPWTQILTGTSPEIGKIAVTSTDDATSATAAPLKTAGGLAVAKSARIGEAVIGRSFAGDGYSIFAYSNNSHILSGTDKELRFALPSAVTNGTIEVDCGFLWLPELNVVQRAFTKDIFGFGLTSSNTPYQQEANVVSSSLFGNYIALSMTYVEGAWIVSVKSLSGLTKYSLNVVLKIQSGAQQNPQVTVTAIP